MSLCYFVWLQGKMEDQNTIVSKRDAVVRFTFDRDGGWLVSLGLPKNGKKRRLIARNPTLILLRNPNLSLRKPI